MKRKLIVIILIAAILCGALAYGILAYRDYTLLRDSAFFADGPIGFAGEDPPYVHAYRRLRANPFAVHIFRALARNGTSAASAYAIMALRELDPEYANELIEEYKIGGQTFETRAGCLVVTVDMNEFFVLWGLECAEF